MNDTSITQLRQDLALAKYAKRTIDGYSKTAERLGARFGRPVAELSRDEVRVFVQELVERNKSSSWLTTQLGALMWLFKKTLARPEMVSFIKYPKKYRPLPTILSLGEVEALIRAVESPRMQAIVMVLYGTGVRITEALALQVGDIDGERGIIRILHGKGNQAREVKLSPTLYQWLRAYWARERPPLPFLFASKHTQKPPRAATVCRALALAAQVAGLTKRVTPHVLRHCFATHLLEEGTDVRVVGALLGHISLTTTLRYARVTEKLVRATPSPIDLLPQRR